MLDLLRQLQQSLALGTARLIGGSAIGTGLGLERFPPIVSLELDRSDMLAGEGAGGRGSDAVFIGARWRRFTPGNVIAATREHRKEASQKKAKQRAHVRIVSTACAEC